MLVDLSEFDSKSSSVQNEVLFFGVLLVTWVSDLELESKVNLL